MNKNLLKKASQWVTVAVGTLALISIGTFALVHVDTFSLLSIRGERSSEVPNSNETDASGNITVNVQDENGEGIGDALVTLYIEEGKYFDEKPSSHRDGYVAFNDVPLKEDSVYVYVEAEGYIPARFYYTGNPRILAELMPQERSDKSPLSFDPGMQSNDIKEQLMDSSESSIQPAIPLSEERALELVQTWLDLKNDIYNLPHDISKVSDILYEQGGLYRCLVRSVIPDLKRETLYYEFAGAATHVKDFYSNSDEIGEKAGGIFTVSETETVRQDRYTAVNETSRRTYSNNVYEFRRDADTGLWQIDDYCPISPEDNKTCEVMVCQDNTLEYEPQIYIED